MKKETIDEANKILAIQERVNEILFKVEENSSTDRDKLYLDRVQIVTRNPGNGVRETNVCLNDKGGYDGNLPLSTDSKIILAHLTKQYHQAVVQLFKAEAVWLQGKLDNLKD